MARTVKEYTLGRLLAKARDREGLSLRAVAEKSGISNAYISQLESGRVSEPSPKKLAVLAHVYKVSYRSLLEAADYPIPDGDTEAPCKRQHVSSPEIARFVEDIESHEWTPLLAFLKTMRSLREELK